MKKGSGMAAAAAPAVMEEPQRARRLGSHQHPDSVAINIRMTAANWQRLRDLATSERTSLQELGFEAFDFLMKARELPPLEYQTPAQLRRDRSNGSK